MRKGRRHEQILNRWKLTFEDIKQPPAKISKWPSSIRADYALRLFHGVRRLLVLRQRRAGNRHHRLPAIHKVLVSHIQKVMERYKQRRHNGD